MLFRSEAFFDAAKFLDENEDENTYGLVGYEVAKTLSKNGSAKRGICKLENGFLTDLIESKVERKEERIIAEPLHGGEAIEVEETQLVSMNMLLFYPNLFAYLEEKIKAFLSLPIEKLEKEEFLIPDVLKNAIDEHLHPVKMIQTKATWYGVTYREDKEEVVDAISKKVEENIYPTPLWK